MLNVRRNFCPLHYEMCKQTVTIYHQNAPGAYTRTVFRRAFLDFRKTRNVEKTGSAESSSFLLVIPCTEPVVSPADKVLLGEGPLLVTREEWAEFIPAKVLGLLIVKYVDLKYWNNKICHEEAGG